MDLEQALMEYEHGDKSQEVIDVIIQDVYGFLESENYHTAVDVIEELTGIKYK